MTWIRRLFISAMVVTLPFLPTFEQPMRVDVCHGASRRASPGWCLSVAPQDGNNGPMLLGRTVDEQDAQSVVAEFMRAPRPPDSQGKSVVIRRAGETP